MAIGKAVISYSSTAPSADDFKALYDTTGWEEGRPLDDFSATLKGSWLLCAAYSGDILVGFGRVISDGRMHAFVTEVMVQPSFQGQGIGKEIVKILVRGCIERDVRDIQLFCAEGKRTFYERLGFAARGETRPGMQFVQLGGMGCGNSIVA